MLGRTRIAELVSRLRQRPPGLCATYEASELTALPAPVARYFRTAVRDGHRIVRQAWLSQRGEILLRSDPPAWRPFSATEAMTAGGFVWDARVRVFPGLAVHVCDSFVNGTGAMRASALGIVPLVRVEGTPQIDEGSLLRYLAEAVWMPTALLPSQGVVWTPLDDANARATIRSGRTTASLDFHFESDGLASGVFTAARPRQDGRAFTPTAWLGRFSDYQRVQGMRIPLRAEAEWLLAEGPQPYWRGRVTGAAYEYEPYRAPRAASVTRPDDIDHGLMCPSGASSAA